MKFKAIFLCVALLLCYFFITNYWQRTGNEIKADQGQWSDNSMKAQAFLYDFDYNKYNCIVGTSLACELIDDSLPANFYNLCFRGQTVLDGLLILKNKSVLPETLFVETNYVISGFNKSFIDKIVGSSLETKLKKRVPMFREKYLPIGWLANYLHSKLGFAFYYYGILFQQAKSKLTFKSKCLEVTNRPIKKNEEILENVLKLDKINMSNLPKNDEITENFGETKRILTELESKGVTIVFFEMPIHCSLIHTKLMELNSISVRTTFSPTKYKYIPNASCSAYNTTDGRHLDKISAMAYTSFFLRNVRLK